MRFQSLLCLALLVTYCKSTSQSMNRRSQLEPSDVVGTSQDFSSAQRNPDSVVIPRSTAAETAAAVEIEQVVTSSEVESAPPIQVEKIDAPPVMIPEIGSQCKPPVTASCLGISSVMTAETQGGAALAKALKKYGRLITPAMHACHYYSRNLARYPNISYFTDLVVYWSEVENNINYWAFPTNFIFSAGCTLDDDFKNPFLASLKTTQTWDGTTSLKSLGYPLGSNLPLPANFTADTLKAEKITQATHACTWAVRPMIYAFPDGVIYQFVGGNTINVYSYNKAIAQGCYLPKALADAAGNYGLVCGRNPMNPDPLTRNSLTELGLLPATPANRALDAALLMSLETNGKPLSKASLKCTFASRNRILQFADGIAFIDDDCTNVNIFTNQLVKDRNCTIP
ncbi:MAG TPA: hypothetical protein VFO10_22015 [Oligoflexus sp.]|uniref:hypothetical protein n=1 Tax=Oligoflexus sp. TaxID=1971216 RepID=UPI002D7F5E6F|nr:hypothetical protein [Oligoflexus sp.]HET9239953.1 hypothetical protein [Oligoflexus sp.]